MTGRNTWNFVAPILMAAWCKLEEDNSYFIDAYTTVYAALRWWDELEEYREKLRKEKQDAPQD